MLERARASGVQAILAIGSGGSGPDRLDAAIPLAEEYDWIYATVAIHPHHAGLATEEHYARLSELAAHRKVIAWGEMGLDYHYEDPPPEVQQTVFRRQLALARAAKLPIVIHCRDAWDDCLAILRKEWAPAGLGGIFHCFTGTLREAQQGIEMGFVVSFAGNVTYPKMQLLRDVARRIAAGETVDGNGFAFSAATGTARKKERAGFCGGGSADACECEKLRQRRSGRRDGGEFQAFFPAERIGRCAAAKVNLRDGFRCPTGKRDF